MPKVSDRHRQRQADHIRRAAEKCFARNGFHATTMDEIIAEAGMSSSTVYRYYPGGKEQLVRAVSTARMDPLLDRIRAFADDEQPRSLEQAFSEGIALISRQSDAESAATHDPDALLRSTRLAVTAWSEAGRNPELGEMLAENYAAIRSRLTGLARRWKADGTVTSALDSADVAALMQNTAFGLVVEQAITGKADIPAAAQRLSRVLTDQSDSF
ncbi:MAG TPA: helix-turn-helix domain-containing protein [Pseudonocardiaceae bacterium]